MKRKLAVVGLATALATMLFATAASAAAERQVVSVAWHAQQASQGNVGDVPGAAAALVRRPNGVTYTIKTSVTPGHAYTVWVVVINNPGACAASPCSGGDVLLNPATDSQVLYGTGRVAGPSGKAIFAGSLAEGPLEGWLADRSFKDSRTAEIHLVLNDHGPALAEFMPGMIRTYRGGCSDASPFPGIFPATALSDGEVGPNTCLLFQDAIFLPA